MGISEVITEIRERIGAAAKRSGRSGEDVTLLAVTKTVPIERIREAVACGVNVLGENRAQELLEKHDAISDAKWHFIGHLQTNKVKYVVDKVELIHSVDSLRLAEEIDRQADLLGKVQDVLVQVNISGEESKFGTGFSECKDLVFKIDQLPNVCVRGLMTIPPIDEKPDNIKKLFEKCNKILIDINTIWEDNGSRPLDVLSMGMSGDYELAVEAGANIVRIGSGIFGCRS